MMGIDENNHLEGYTCNGNCHCGRVQFIVNVAACITVQKCNCSICEKTGFVHLLVKQGDFKIIRGDNELTEYRFNTGVARHLFCRICGVKAFYVPRSHPEGYSVNLNCVNLNSAVTIIYEEFDGQNWSQNIAALRNRE